MPLSHHARHGNAPRLIVGLVLLAGLMAADPAAAQRPFRIYDPLYRNESARRAFFDGYAFTGELSYRSAGEVRDAGLVSGNADLGLTFRFDYQLLPQVDLSAILDATGGTTGRRLSVSWVTLKLYRTVEHTDYALRLAVDPSSDARTGFPQMDFAFLYTTLLAGDLSADYALGLRRVQIGYEEIVPVPAGPSGQDDPIVVAPAPSFDILYKRALGWEAHAMVQYSALIDPARSNVFLSVLFEGGRYDVVESSRREATAAVEAAAKTGATPGRSEYRGGVVWLQSGIEYNRPGYQIIPYASVRALQWSSSEENPAPLHVGVRLMLR